MRIGVRASMISTGVLRALLTSVEMPDVPGPPGWPPAPLATTSVSAKLRPSAPVPAKAITAATPALAAVAAAGAILLQAPMMALQASLTVPVRSEEHTSELQSLMRISYAVFCLKKKTKE